MYLLCEGHPCWIEKYYAPHYSLTAPVRLMCHLLWLATCPSWAGAPLAMVSWLTLLGQFTTCHGFPAHLAGPVHHLHGFLIHPAGSVQPLAVAFWPTWPGMFTICPWFAGPPCWAGALLVMVTLPTLLGMCTTCHGFLPHPARPVHHLPWFFDPPCRAGAPLAVVF